MNRTDFEFDLPSHLIAHFPTPERNQSRMLCLNGETGAHQDSQFSALPTFLEPGDLLVFNNTKVIRARLFGQKQSGGKVEVLIERITSPNTAIAHIRSSKSPKPDQHLILNNTLDVTVLSRQADLFELQFNHDEPILSLLEKHGHMPLPPYISRDDTALDETRYQTVYGTEPGAVAAPTAGLHFDETMFDTLEKKGVQSAFVTLHVGSGTFQPVRVENIHDHIMHAEYIEIDQPTIDLIKQTKANGKRVIAVGTTSVRVLESVAHNHELQPYCGDTDIFIYPGYTFKIIDALITNFHLPGSTLIMLVSAFAGREHTLNAYQHAIQSEYRFFSYGDAMFITPQNSATTATQSTTQNTSDNP